MKVEGLACLSWKEMKGRRDGRAHFGKLEKSFLVYRHFHMVYPYPIISYILHCSRSKRRRGVQGNSEGIVMYSYFYISMDLLGCDLILTYNLWHNRGSLYVTDNVSELLLFLLSCRK